MIILTLKLVIFNLTNAFHCFSFTAYFGIYGFLGVNGLFLFLPIFLVF